MAKQKKTPIKARNKFVLAAIYKTGAGAHGDTKHNTHKRDRQRFKQGFKNGKYDPISA